MGTETQEMVEEEVVQFVRADQVLCLLLDVAVLVCRDQFGADRRVDDIQQGEAGGIVHLVIGNPFDQVFDQCFRDAAVHAVHRHMVAVVGRPAECQFGEVAGSDHEAVLLVGDIHQQLGPFACLAVFVGHVMDGRIMVDVAEMLKAGFLDRDLFQCDAEGADEVASVSIGAVGCTEAGHRDADDLPPWHFQSVERHDGHEQSQGGVQPA